MPSRIDPIASIRLARSWPRLLALPLLLLLLGAAGAVVGVFVIRGPLGVGIAGAGGFIGLAGIAIAAVLASVRVEIEESAVRLRRIGGERVYPLTPGPVTRVRLRGENASTLRSRSRSLGWSLGRARLRDEEDIEIVRLARTPTVILLPTERGRLAIAPADDAELLDALARAARARQRLDELAVPAAPAVAPPPEPVVPPEVEEPHILTGIERALLEERLGQERRAEAEAAAAAEATAAEAAAAVPEEQSESAEVAEAAPAASRRRAVRPSWARLPRVAVRRPRPSAVLVLFPLIGAGSAWGAGLLAGGMPEAGTDLARLTSLALVLSGPATSVGAILARAWWPRMVGVVVAGGLAASVFIGRALVGG